MAIIESIEVNLQTAEQWGGTSDAVYIGVISENGGREFPLRYQKNGTTLTDGASYTFGFGAASSGYEMAWDAQTGGTNSPEAYPIDVESGRQSRTRVYIRKEPANASGQSDNALFLTDVSVNIRFEGEAFYYRSRHGTQSEPSVVRLANEHGAITYLYTV